MGFEVIYLETYFKTKNKTKKQEQEQDKAKNNEYFLIFWKEVQWLLIGSV